jgi:hypothetical protein
MAQVVGSVESPVLALRVDGPTDLDALVDEIEEELARERAFALHLTGPEDLLSWERILWHAPEARRRLRRQRASLAAWCEATWLLGAHLSADELRRAELIWGCRVVAA